MTSTDAVNIAAVALGGAVGAAARFALNGWALTTFGPGFPWATLIANVAGAFAMGVLAEALVLGLALPLSVRLGLMTGLLGGFTTFSAFALDATVLGARGEVAASLIYVIGSVAGALIALIVGQWCARAVFSA
ncbi:MAG: CrcB family protein [Pseudomonadota bacterium]